MLFRRGGRQAAFVTVVIGVAAALAVGSLTPSAGARADSADPSVPTPTVTSSVPAGTDTATPPPTPAPNPTSGSTDDDQSDALGGSDPSLQVMNAAHDHSMGSTISTNEAAAPKARSLAAEPLAAGQPSGTQGLDVSGWQSLTRANWTTIYNNGARFVYVKATESTDYTSGEFSEQYNDSYAAGLSHGAYHFATPNTSSGASQATFFVANGGGWSADGRTLPPLLDIEYNPYGATCYGLSQAAMVSWIKDFSNTMLSRTGRLPAIYSTTDWWTQCTGNSNAFPNNPLFIARYTTSGSVGTLPASWSAYTFWQWADSGTFPGDQDVFNGSTSQLAALALSGTPRLPEPVIAVGDLNRDGHPDLLARRTDGDLWYYAGTGSNGIFRKPVLAGGGWNQYDELIGVGDLNGDGIPDLLARTPAGALWFYGGTGTGATFHARIQIGTGWNVYNRIIGAGDLNHDGHPDLVARRPDGTLWYYSGTGKTASTSQSGLSSAVQIGTGWDVYTTLFATGDLNGDGRPDLEGVRQDGSLWYYAGTGLTPGSTQTSFAKGVSVAMGYAPYLSLIGAGDVTGDKRPDLIGFKSNGTMWLLSGLGSAGNQVAALTSGVQIGTGWSVYSTLFGSGDLNSDGHPDLLGTRTNGSLWYYAGTGTTSGSGNAGLARGTQVGTGWNVYTKLLSAGDLNGDGKPDLLGVRANGTLWYYAGNGKATSTTPGLAKGVEVGTGWNVYTKLLSAGDLNGDGKPDLLGVRANGTLWYYAGNGKATSTTPGLAKGVEVGTGWNVYTKLVGGNDLSGDGKADLFGVRPNGTLWYYAGNGKATSTNAGFASGVQIGTGWNVYTSVFSTGDLGGDGRPDILGTRANGTLWYYAGHTTVPTSGLSSAVQIGNGWNIYG